MEALEWCNELATAVEYKLPIIIAILNNRALGMVRQWQIYSMIQDILQLQLTEVRILLLFAEAFGAMGISVTNLMEVDEAITRALSQLIDLC